MASVGGASKLGRRVEPFNDRKWAWGARGELARRISDVRRQPRHDRLKDRTRRGKRVLNLVARGSFGFARVAKSPGIFGERNSPVDYFTQRRIDAEALFTELFEVVRLAKHDIVPDEERLASFSTACWQ